MSIRIPFSFCAATTTRASRRRWSLAACILSSVVLFSGCAKDPPSSSSSIALSGKRLRVTMRFQNPVNPAYHYYFLINYDQSVGVGGNKNGIGPIAVLGPVNSSGTNIGYGNGFASGSGGSAYGFTDFVKYENNAYSLMHVVGSPTVSNFVFEGQPIAFTLPNSGNPNVLQFDIDFSQIVVSPTGAALDPTTTVANAKAIQWLEINMVATDVVPAGQNIPVNKQVDALGNTVEGDASYLTLDMTQFQTYTNSSFAGQNVYEPENDVWPLGSGGDPSLDLVDWSISVVQQQ